MKKQNDPAYWKREAAAWKRQSDETLMALQRVRVAIGCPVDGQTDIIKYAKIMRSEHCLLKIKDNPWAQSK